MRLFRGDYQHHRHEASFPSLFDTLVKGDQGDIAMGGPREQEVIDTLISILQYEEDIVFMTGRNHYIDALQVFSYY